MRKSNRLLCLLLVFVAFSGAACSKVPAGNVGVKVFLLGGDKGVDSQTLSPGRYWIGFNEELYLFPTFTKNYVWTAAKDEGSPNNEEITFQTKEGMEVSMDVGIAYHIPPDKAAGVFQKYRKGIDEITDIFLRNTVRDAFVSAGASRPVESVYGEGKSALLAEVQKNVAEQVKEIGIEVEKVYLVGSMRLPQQVVAALNAKIQATQTAQQRENEVREAEAAAKKAVAVAQGDAESTLVRAESQAKANRLLSESITETLVRYRSLEKWDGKLPTTMIPGTATPFIGVK